MLGPLPSLLTAPSIWYAAVLVPNRKPGGNRGMPSDGESPTGTICHVAVEIRRGTDRFVERQAGRLTAHAFSFGSSYDADHVRFGPMVCHDDHLLRVGEGFAAARPCRPDDRHLGDLGGARARRPDRPGAGRARTGRGAPHRLRRHALRGGGGAADPVRPGLADRRPSPRSRRTRSRRPSCRPASWSASPSPSPARCSRWSGSTTTRPSPSPPDRAPTSTSAAARCSARRSPSRCTRATRSCSPTSPRHELTAGVPSELLVWSFG